MRVWDVTLACLRSEKPRDWVVSSSVLPARALLIERRLRNATHVIADDNEGTVIGKARRSKVAQTCWRMGCLLFVVCLPHIGRLVTWGY